MKALREFHVFLHEVHIEDLHDYVPVSSAS